MSKFISIPNFDSLSPQTTKGDLVGRTTTGATRIPVGADNTVLTSDSSNALGVAWKSASQNNAVYTLTGATTLPASSQTVLVSGTTFTITLPSPSSNSGLEFNFVKTDANTTAQYITGTGWKGMTLCTQLEELSIICDGTTYWPKNHKTFTGITSTVTSWNSTGGTQPGKGASIVTDTMTWMRMGGLAFCQFAYSQQTGGTQAQGDYLLNLPGGLIMDSSVAFNATLSDGGAFFPDYGHWFGTNVSANFAWGYLVPYGSTQMRLVGNLAAINTRLSAGGILSFNNTQVRISGQIVVPISGWNGD